ncbi:MAG: HAD-IIB family hydrolase [Lachnospiraceae bacterium]|nr:HAD-IIB family hydrolase [Lachnospiraceae bacterium]
MIKLIVTDMDGCLLDKDNHMPPNFAEAFELMKKEHVVFAAASGRSIDGLRKPFGQFADSMTFITDNGARIYHEGRWIAETMLTRDDYMPMLEDIRRYDGVLPVACGETTAWVEHADEITDEMRHELLKYYPSWKECYFDSIPERVMKFALLYFDDIEKNIYPYFKKYDNERICVQVTAYVWIDIYLKEVSKGSAVGKLQQILDISPEETVIFGDYLNDISMADFAAMSCAPANAHPDVIKRFTDTIRPNTEYGVTHKIIEMLG